MHFLCPPLVWEQSGREGALCQLINLKVEKPRREEDDHRDDDEDGDNAPRIFRDFSRAMMKKKTHNVTSTNDSIYHMKEFEQRRHPLRLLGLRLFTIGLLFIAFALVRGVWGVYEKERETYAGRATAEQELQGLKEREIKLRGDIVRLQTPEGVEESLRQQFDMAKEGEGVIVIVDREAVKERSDGGFDMQNISGWKRLLPLAPWKLFGQ